MIPDEILKDIVSRAKESWPDDKGMQKFCITQEKEGYAQLQSLDFGDLEDQKEEIIRSEKEIEDDWSEVFHAVEAEVEACRDFKTFSVPGVDKSVIDAWKEQAADEIGFLGKLGFIEERARKHVSIIETRKNIDPIKYLLIELEQIVGNECYNGSIQNYSSWGELESTGRQFRYPLKFYTDKGESKKWNVPGDMPSEELITGYYPFGANELNVFRALFKIVQHLREKYGLDV